MGDVKGILFAQRGDDQRHLYRRPGRTTVPFTQTQWCSRPTRRVPAQCQSRLSAALQLREVADERCGIAGPDLNIGGITTATTQTPNTAAATRSPVRRSATPWKGVGSRCSPAPRRPDVHERVMTCWQRSRPDRPRPGCMDAYRHATCGHRPTPGLSTQQTGNGLSAIQCGPKLGRVLRRVSAVAEPSTGSPGRPLSSEGATPSSAVLVNGAHIGRSDVQQCAETGRPVVNGFPATGSYYAADRA